MAEPSIGSQTFLSMRNAIPYAGEIVEEITRPAMFGVAFRVTGMKGEPVTVMTRTLCYSEAAVDNAMYAYSLMQGYIYSLTDEFGNTRPWVMVRSYRPVRAFRTYYGSTVPSGVYGVLDSEWVLQDVEF